MITSNKNNVLIDENSFLGGTSSAVRRGKLEGSQVALTNAPRLFADTKLDDMVLGVNKFLCVQLRDKGAPSLVKVLRNRERTWRFFA